MGEDDLEKAIHNKIADALKNGTTYINVRQAAKDVLALIRESDRNIERGHNNPTSYTGSSGS